ncbi:MAG: PAS domain-containing protein [Rubrivivax sp.]|nr:PAS domain-containing protein [Rubrivivax sp.]
MKPEAPAAAAARDDEIAALIETLHAADRRLAELTHGEVDTVANQDGRTALLQPAQEQLRDAEVRKQAALLDALPVHIALLDAQGVIVSVNDAWRRFADTNGFREADHGVGQRHAEVCGRACGAGDEEAAQLADGVRAVLAGERSAFSIEYPCPSAAGQRWFLMTVNALETGRLSGAVVWHVDITERKQAELRTSQLAARLTNTLESITDGFFMLDRDWCFSYINGVAERLLQRRRDGLMGRSLWDEFQFPLGGEFERAYRRAMAERLPVTFEAFYAPLKSWYRVNAYPSEESLSVYFRDVTSERVARQHLELLEASVAQLNDIVVITEVPSAHAPGLRIVFVNPAFTRVTGYTRDEVLGHSPRLLNGPLTDRAELKRIGAALARLEPVHAELLNYHKSGRPYWVELDIAPVGIAGEGYTHFVSVERDITERRTDQDALRELNASLEARVRARTAELKLARDQAEQANRAKSSFLAIMSHEIRTPMNGVIGMIDVLERSSLRPSQVEIVRTVRESAYALLTIVDDVLDFSKIEAGQFQIDSEPMDVAAVVEAVCDTLDSLAAGKGVSLRLFTDPALPQGALGDAARLRQILINLIGNAIKFSSGPGRQGRVFVRAVLGTDAAAAATLTLSVADNGIGMDAATLIRIFTPFTQADSGTTRRYGGTGLGLSISHRLAALMGGEIHAVTEPGRGSTFTLRLPLAALPSQRPAARRSLDGLPCLVLGSADGTADDVAAYLAHAGAAVHRVPTRAAATTWLARAGVSECVVVIVDADDSVDATVAACRDLAPAGPAPRPAFVLIGQGRRRRPRRRAADVISLDAEGLRRAVFLRAVALASGRVADEPRGSGQGPDSMPAALDSADATQGRKRILVAEDNEINQKVLRKQLTLLGFRADITSNGQEALDATHDADYDLLLTDLHMPQMDGYELAAAVRAGEAAAAAAGRPRLPIVALTANAVKGEARRCLDAGMDDYMTKPVQLATLKAMLTKWLVAPANDWSDPPRAGNVPATTPQTPARPPADLDVLRSLVGNDPAVIREVLALFGPSSLQAGETIRQGVAEGRMELIVEAAHSLKSSARSIGALQLGQTCADLEQAAHTSQLDALNVLLQRFEAEMVLMQRFLDDLEWGPAALARARLPPR